MKNPLILFAALILCSAATAQTVCPIPTIMHRELPEAGPLVNVPLKESNPGGRKVMLLDMYGRTMASAAWGFPLTTFAPPNITAEAAEEIFHAVAEDYILWDLNVTTDTAVYNAADSTKRMRVLITPTSAWYLANSGGVAYVGSFTWGNDEPCFVFSDRLGNYAKYIAECVSHESGHTLGLQHQSRWVNGVKTEVYHSGTGTPGTHTSWAPIMGVSYYNNNTTWAEGINTYSAFQPDMAIIGSAANGLQLRAAAPNLVRPNLTTSNTITLARTSLVTIAATSAGNTDLKIKINGIESNIPDSLDARITAITLPAGTHSLEVSPALNPNNPTGYGNAGQFVCNTSITPLGTVAIDTNSVRYQRARLANFRADEQFIYFKATIYAPYKIFSIGGQRIAATHHRPGINKIFIGFLPPGAYALSTEYATHRFVKLQ